MLISPLELLNIGRNEMNLSQFVEQLTNIQLDCVFNPYSERCRIFDREDAAEIRKANLSLLLKAAQQKGIHSIWLGRDLGYRGGRRTGIPLTDEAHLHKMGETFGVKLSQATAGPLLQERTATLIWQVLPLVSQRVFFWNVFPLHPFERGQPLSNRCHNRDEREIGRHFLVHLLELLQPKQIVAIGKDAESALSRLNLTCSTVRHPSYGGQTEFLEGIEDLYKISVQERNLALL